MTGDRTPTGDLRERLAEALEPVTVAATPAEAVTHRLALNRAALVVSPAAFDALVDAVLPVVEAETAALRERAAAELEERIQGMRENGDNDMRTVLDHVRNVLRSKA